MAKRQTVKIKYVYWKNGAWRYQAQGKLEREILGKSWIRLGTTEEEKALNYWKLIGSKLGKSGGMDLLWDRYRSEVLPRKQPRTARDDEKMWKLMRPVFQGCHPSQITRQFGIEYLIARGVRGINGFDNCKCWIQGLKAQRQRNSNLTDNNRHKPETTSSRPSLTDLITTYRSRVTKKLIVKEINHDTRHPRINFCNSSNVPCLPAFYRLHVHVCSFCSLLH